jgi:type IX secretion system PorP/SprF family membrane protein
MRAIKIITLLGSILACGTALGQQQAMFTQYMFNGLAINPAYAGSHRTLSATALARIQWAGVDGAPVTQTLSVHGPISNRRVGLGLLVLHDEIGVTKQTGAYGAFSYRIPFQNQGQLSFGIQGGFSSYNARFSLVSEIDPTFTGVDIKELQPNFGAGVFYSTKLFYVGFSVPQLVQNTFDKYNPDSDAKLLRHYFLTSGYVFQLDNDLMLKPSILIKAVSGAPVQFDFNMSLLMKERLWVGLSWRSFDSVDALFQLQLTERLQFGYAYDFATTSDMRRINAGSHEFMLNYRVVKRGSRIKTPRYF